MKVTTYMPPGMVADLQALAAELMRQGIRVDRGALIRAAIAMSKADPERWKLYVEEES